MEGGRKRKAVEQDGGYDAPGQGADINLADNADPGDGASENMRAREKNQEEHEHDARELVAGATPHQTHGIGVVLYRRILQLDLTDEVAGVDGDESDAHSQDDAGHHAHASEGAGHAEGA